MLICARGGGDVHAHIDIRDVDAANFSLQTTRLGLYILYTPSGLNSTGGGARMIQRRKRKVGCRIFSTARA
jgi:hypothetical protein